MKHVVKKALWLVRNGNLDGYCGHASCGRSEVYVLLRGGDERMTIDELINALERIKESHGGDCTALVTDSRGIVSRIKTHKRFKMVWIEGEEDE